MVNAPDTDELKQRLIATARELGFAAVGFAPAVDDPLRGRRLQEWLAAGCHGEMAWMEDRAEVSSLAHRLRSAARTLGAEHLADMLGALEEGEPEGTTLTAVVSAVTEEMRLVVSELSSLVTAEASS